MNGRAERPGPADGAGEARDLHPRKFDLLNLTLVDVNGGLRPYLNVFLLVHREWSATTVGLVTTIAGLIGVGLQAPLGAVIDRARDKRMAIVAALLAASAGAAVIAIWPQFWPVLVAFTVLTAAGSSFTPTIAGLTLGIFPKARLSRRMGRNSAWYRGGNVCIAVLIALVGYGFPDRAVFFLVPALSLLAAAAVLSIPRDIVGQELAEEVKPKAKSGSALKVLLANRPLLIFAASIFLFQLANGPMASLVAQKISLAHEDWSAAITSTTIIAAQVVMLPMAIMVGRFADGWGRKPIILFAFAMLPVRALLYTVSDDAIWLFAVQSLEGVSTGLYSAIKPLMIADFMEDKRRYNLASGAIATVQGVAIALSNVLAGSIVDLSGFTAAFLVSSAIGSAAALLLTRMPEPSCVKA
ncbi:MFS transporter [Methylobacterium sp. WL103]|jgi:MFS family permease|uniref:MFS transporter n=1 Tax=unclassified Methylobacterium TaxID=2615210 RepID=UPI0011C74C02|nr:MULTISPECIES: MFS transporter [unclassified Methylobacterium]TXN06782.1 MFS transporter [Methylobacterium sp. WL103]TXN11323.1 MFS transporter [Methylobacterium sp. WL122]TXN79174.1 MFS transporter [Methylobacterium sp. WL8]